MVLYCGIALVLCAYRIKYGFSSDYLCKTRTTSLKGIFILLVFFSHFNAYVTFESKTDLMYVAAVAYIGQGMVTPFLFCSGYGVMESIKRKGPSYVKAIPVTRILATLFRFDIAVCLFAIVQSLLGAYISIPQFITSLLAWNKIGNSNWYIFDMLVLYTVTYVVFLFSYKKRKPPTWAIVGITLCCFLFMGVMLLAKRGSWWYDTILCYPLGMLWSVNQEKIDQFLRNFRYWVPLTLLSAIGTVLMRLLPIEKFSDILSNLFFCNTVILLSMRISCTNKLLDWLGTHLFEIYILMRIPMIICQRTGYMLMYPYLTFAICITVTILMAWGYRKAINALWSKLLNAISPKKP